MKFLVDGSGRRLLELRGLWPDVIAGQLLTPITRYRLADEVFAIDNGAFSGFQEYSFFNLLKRNDEFKDRCLFVAVPDKVGDHKVTLQLWDRYKEKLAGWKLAFVAQDGYGGEIPKGADVLFIGGTNAFKESSDAVSAVRGALAKGLRVHVGRVNTKHRYGLFEAEGAQTCDGSGVSAFREHTVAALLEWERLNKFWKKEGDTIITRKVQRSIFDER